MAPIAAVVFDLSGTVIDFGSRGPVVAFQELFRRHGVEVTADQARGPMGLHKKDHIAAMFTDAAVARAWQERHGEVPSARVIDRLYEEFPALQVEVLKQHCDVIAGVPETVAALRARGIKIGATTGFDTDMLVNLEPAARANGFTPDFILCPDQVGGGRPAPWMMFEAARRWGIYPMSRIVKVGDTRADIAEGRNAGAWVVSVVDSGNEVGLSAGEWDAASSDDRKFRRSRACSRLASGHPDFLISTVAELMPVIDAIEDRMSKGLHPGAAEDAA
jgi:phosphonoacetaldehyde hydrolase